uniref:Ribosome-recycling factor, mitochondrial n=1 Tax=Strongyloides stercoralis TaxID=6248 RepID=A0A0K0EKX0_STRER
MIRRFILLSRRVASHNNAIQLLPKTPVINNLQQRNITLSLTLNKVKKGTKSKDSAKEMQHIDTENPILVNAKKEMEELEKSLIDELSRHFSLQIDLRVYEDILVKLDDGTSKKMKHIARVSCKSSNMVMINFADNPETIKSARIALQKSSLNVNPQQEGIVLYIPVPRMTKERREQLANTAKTKVFNEYKKALNEVYIKSDEKSTKTTKTKDDAIKNRTALLAMKKAMENKGMDLIQAKQKALLSEIV